MNITREQWAAVKVLHICEGLVKKGLLTGGAYRLGSNFQEALDYGTSQGWTVAPEEVCAIMNELQESADNEEREG